MYNPLVDKSPYGGAVANGPISIRFPVSSEMHVKRVFIILRKIFGEGGACEGEHLRFELCLASKGSEDVFKGGFALPEWGIYKYRFEGELENGDLAFFGRAVDGSAIRGDWLPEWQLTVSKYAYKTPNWAKEGVIYQIFADRFCSVDVPKFKKKGRLHTYWNERPDIAEEGFEYQANDFFGGNAKGIISRLDYLAGLGVSCIYLSPIFEAVSNHRYDVGNYLKVDELFGTEEEFRSLIECAKKKGIKIILDGVFNHTGADSLYFNKKGHYPTVGAYQSKNSPYFDWYTFFNYPNEYHCWWGSTVVPTVNKSAKGWRQLVLGDGGVIDKWCKAGIAGWRLDVVDELPIDFTTDLCTAIKAHGDDMLIIGEVWEDASVKIAYDLWRPYFMGGQLDSVMNYPFKEAILAYALGGSAYDFKGAITIILEHYPKQSLDALMNLIDSHDTVRALTALSGVTPPDSKLARAEFKLSSEQYALAKTRLMFASALQFTLPGVPCVYYGDEAGMQGFEDPLNRGTYPWGGEDVELLAHYRTLGKMRKKYRDRFVGETHFVDDDTLVIFKRVSESGNVTVFANGTDCQEVRECTGKDALTGREIKSKIIVKPHSVRIVVD